MSSSLALTVWWSRASLPVIGEARTPLFIRARLRLMNPRHRPYPRGTSSVGENLILRDRGATEYIAHQDTARVRVRGMPASWGNGAVTFTLDSKSLNEGKSVLYPTNLIQSSP
jgi:hypothetical protein